MAGRTRVSQWTRMLLFGVLVGRFCFLNVDSKTNLEFDSKAKLSLFYTNKIIIQKLVLGNSGGVLQCNL